MAAKDTWDCIDETGNIVAAGVERAATPASLLVGLSLSRRRRPLWLEQTSIIHTFGMLYPLDVCFISADGIVLKVAMGVCPGRIVFGPVGTRSILEIPAAGAATLGRGRTLCLVASARERPIGPNRYK